MGDRVEEVEEVVDRHIGHLKDGSSISLMNLDGVFRYRHRPEDAGWADARLVVMNLRAAEGIHRILEDVESDEGERLLMAFTVEADVDTFHQAHIDEVAKAGAIAGCTLAEDEG
jgi:hypothetical protein